MKRFLFAVLLLAFAQPLAADEEASNIPHVVASEYGQCYAKSIPVGYRGSDGTTRVYRVGAEADILLFTFDWFSQRIYLECNVSPPSGPVGVSVVRMGPWSRGHEAVEADLAIAFYFDGKLVHKYSTLDIAGVAENVSQSVSHYTVIEKVVGYKWSGTSNRYDFIVETIDERTLRFDAATGKE